MRQLKAPLPSPGGGAFFVFWQGEHAANELHGFSTPNGAEFCLRMPSCAELELLQYTKNQPNQLFSGGRDRD
jgi:hypothetical protein